MFFNEQGILSIDEHLINNASFQKIMEDGVVTEEEIQAQANSVVALLHDMERKYTIEQLLEINELLTEVSALYAAYNYHQIQTLNK